MSKHTKEFDPGPIVDEALRKILGIAPEKDQEPKKEADDQ